MNKLIVQAVLAITLVGPATAADLYNPQPLPPITEPGGFEARWQVTAAAYLWMPSISGTVGIGALPPVDVDLSFSDVLENLDFGYMAVTEFRHDRFGVFTDRMYTKISGGGTGPLGILQASVTNQIFTATLMGEYRVVDQGKSSVDLMAGARIWGLSGEFTINVAGEGSPGAGVSGSGEKWWVDPMVGVKGRLQGASPWFLAGWAMVGGFGAAADIDWDLFGGLGYEFSDRFSLVAGYRALGVDYQDGNFRYDVIQQGPVLGAVFRF